MQTHIGMCVCVCMYIACVGWMIVKSLQTDSFLQISPSSRCLVIQLLSSGTAGTWALAWLVQLMGDEAQSPWAHPTGTCLPAGQSLGAVQRRDFRITCHPLPSEHWSSGAEQQAAPGPQGRGRGAAGHSPAYQSLHAGLCPGFVHSPVTVLSACAAFAVQLKDKNKLISLQTSFTAEQHRLSHRLVYYPFLSVHHPHPLPALWTSDFPGVGNLNYCLLSYGGNLLCTLTRYFILIYVNVTFITFLKCLKSF